MIPTRYQIKFSIVIFLESLLHAVKFCVEGLELCRLSKSWSAIALLIDQDRVCLISLLDRVLELVSLWVVSCPWLISLRR